MPASIRLLATLNSSLFHKKAKERERKKKALSAGLVPRMEGTGWKMETTAHPDLWAWQGQVPWVLEEEAGLPGSGTCLLVGQRSLRPTHFKAQRPAEGSDKRTQLGD